MTNIYPHDKLADNMPVGDYPCPYHHNDTYRVAFKLGRGNRTYIYFLGFSSCITGVSETK